MKSMLTYFLSSTLLLCLLGCVIQINSDGYKYLDEKQLASLSPFQKKNLGKQIHAEAAENIRFEEITADEIQASLGKAELSWVYIWGSWCRPCIEKLPSLTQIAEDKGKKLQILLIAEDYGIESLQRLLFRFKYPYQSYILKNERYGKDKNKKIEILNGELCESCEFDDGFPQNYVFNKKGELLYYGSGAIEDSIMIDLGLQ